MPDLRSNPTPVWRRALALAAVPSGVPASAGPSGFVVPPSGGPLPLTIQNYPWVRAQIEAHGPPALRELLTATEALIERWGAAWSECERNSRRREILRQYAAALPAVCQDPSARLAVAVTCHAPYIPRLNACLQAIEAQDRKPDQRFLALDRCELSQQQEYYALAHGWTIRHFDAGSPNPGRQWALQTTDCPWLWHVDADDAHDPAYLAGAAALTGDPRVGIIHADRVWDGGALRTPQSTDYWGLRLANYVDTSSLWRVAALRAAGGWTHTERWDDWDCALRVTALGWQTVRNPVPSHCTTHADRSNRNVASRDFPHKWNRTYAVVALLAGRGDLLPEWSRLVEETEYAPRTHFHLADNSHSAAFGDCVRDLAGRLSRRGFTVTTTVLTDTFHDTAPAARHAHVAHLYNRILPGVTEDLTLLWEDDVLPLTPFPVRALVDHWDCTKTGGICAAYECRDHPGAVCAATAHDYWRGMPALSAVRGAVHPGYGFLPGGFALYNTALIRQALPFSVQYLPPGKMQGWDGQLSRAIRAAGWRLDLDGTIECEHRWQRPPG